jgi:hydroxyacylglutathione hydrolase
VWPGHGAGSSCGKSIGAVPVSSVGYEKRTSDALADADLGEGSFVEAILADQPTPPTYFGRMKRDNRDGPPLLRRLPQPRRLGAVDLPHLVRHGETVVVDTRPDRSAFMRAHLPGSLHAPFDRSFNTTVGGLVAESTRPIVLLIEQGSLDVAVRSLVRIGYDMVVAYFESSVLEEHLRDGGERSAIREIDFRLAETLRKSSDYLVVDVRDHFEFAREHIPGAVNAPHVRLPEYLPTRISQGRPLIVHCESGVRSATASAWLAAQGREVLYVNDDWSDRQARGGEVDRGCVQPGTGEPG